MTTKAADSLINELEVFFKRRNEGMTLLAQSTLTGSVTSVTFSSIPQGFRHLVLFSWARSDRVAELDSLPIRFNADSGNNYDYQQIVGSSTSVTSATGRAQTAMFTMIIEAASSRASTFSGNITFIFNYLSSSAEKRIMSLAQVEGNLSADADLIIEFASGGWRSTASITSITIFPGIGTNLVSGSSFQLYGIT